MKRALALIALPIAHHALVLACRVTLIVVEHGLPDTAERERVQASVTYLCSR